MSAEEDLMPAPAVGLEPSEVTMLTLFAENASRAHMAQALGWSTTTLDRRFASLRQRFQVETNIEVVVQAVREGLV